MSPQELAAEGKRLAEHYKQCGFSGQYTQGLEKGFEIGCNLQQIAIDSLVKENDELKKDWKAMPSLMADISKLTLDLGRHKKAIELAMYYINGDSAYEIAKAKIDALLGEK